MFRRDEDGEIIQAPRSIEECHERELNGLKRSYEAGSLPARLDALIYCERNSLPQPKWLQLATIKEGIENLRGGKQGRRGRTANAFARYRMDMVHLERYYLVVSAREKQKHWAGELEGLRELGNAPKHHLEEAEYFVSLFGSTRDDAYEFVAEDLGHRGRGVSAETVKASYNYVARLSKNPRQAPRFRVLSYYLNRSLGLELDG